MQARARARAAQQLRQHGEEESGPLFWTRHYQPLFALPRDTGWRQEQARILALALQALM